jgi:hypothetical protein
MRSSSTSSTRTYMPPAESEQPDSKPPKSKRNFRVSKKYLPWVFVAVLLLLSLFLLSQYKDAKQKVQSSNTASQTATLLNDVRKIFVLPTSGTPTIATVSSVDKLKNQEFFANAKDGDKVIVYSAEKRAILYRPSTQQIVNVAPLSDNSIVKQ